MTVALLFSISILVLAISALLAFGNNNRTEKRYVNDDQMQAVFLNGGQVYFGDITNLTDDYLRMSNIYYLRVNQQVQPNGEAKSTDNDDISLVKLGCELHGPEDAMVINRSQVMFWENLKSDGQVAKAVEQYVKQNPDGQKCEVSTQSTDSDSKNNN